MFKRKERISKKALIHSSLGEYTHGDKQHPPRLNSGGHGEECVKELEKRGIEYNINKQYPNGVRLGNVPTHKKSKKRVGNNQVWFPEKWNRNTIKKAGEKVINSIPYKLPDGMNTFGTYKNVKVVVKRTNGIISTIFPYHKQSGGRKNDKK